MKIKQEYRLGIGISAMLLIFVIISIVTLGVLSFLSAKADKALTDKSIDMVCGYYEASAAAQRRLMEMDNDFASVMSTQEMDAYAEEEGMVYEDGALYFSVDAGSGRMLNVTVGINEQFQIREITQYTIENSEEWSPEFSDFSIF